MAERSAYHSKKPDEAFSEIITENKPTSTSNTMLLYNVLEEKRLAQ